jgi:transposase
LFSYFSLAQRVPPEHPLRKLRILVDAVVRSMDKHLAAMYATRGRPSIPPEVLVRALLLQILYAVRPERQLVEQIDYNPLFRWFVGLGIEERVWDHSSFSQNRKRLFDEGMARHFFERVKRLAAWQELMSNEHYSVDGTMIEAWASHKSFRAKERQDPSQDGLGGRNA